MKTLVLTDSAGAMSKEQAAALGIEWLPLQIFIGGRQYLDGIDLSREQLYRMLSENEFPSTSQPPLLLVQSALASARRSGVTDLVSVHLASGMSSTAQLIENTAKSMGLQVHTFDTCSAQAVQYYLAYSAAILSQKGVPAAAIKEKLQKAWEHSNSYLIVNDIRYLMKGGRLRPLKAKLSSVFGIRPVLEISRRTDGLAELCCKTRTVSKAIDRAVERIASEIDPNREYEFFVDGSGCRADIDLAIARLRERFGGEISIHTLEMCSLVSCHVGPGSLALQYIEKIDGVSIADAPEFGVREV